MDHEKIKERIAPCGIHCGKCFAYTEGDIKDLSTRLKVSLGNFDVYAERFADLLKEPVFKKYPDFRDMLSYFASVECKGCRKEKCRIFKECKVRDCHEQKKVDYCYQCPDFPCNNTGFDEHLYKRSVDINKRMREIGPEKYYDEIRDKSRY